MHLAMPSRFSDLKLRGIQTYQTTTDIVNRVASVTGKTRVELLAMPYPLIEEAHRHLESLMTTETTKHLETFTLDGTEYGFIPNWDELTMGEWIDLDNACTDFWQNAHKVMSILFRPVTRRWKDQYEIEPYTAKEDSSVFLDMPADQVAGALLFFSTTRNELLTTLRFSLMREADKTIRLVKSGVGTPSSTTWRERISSKWMRSPNFRSATFSRTSHLSKT